MTLTPDDISVHEFDQVDQESSQKHELLHKRIDELYHKFNVVLEMYNYNEDKEHVADDILNIRKGFEAEIKHVFITAQTKEIQRRLSTEQNSQAAEHGKSRQTLRVMVLQLPLLLHRDWWDNFRPSHPAPCRAFQICKAIKHTIKST